MLVIKKLVDLSSLGEAYADIKLEFKSIPAKNLPELSKKQEALGEDTEKILPFFIEILQEYFISGTQGEQDIVKEDIEELDSESLIYCFQILTGVDIDPKAEGELTSSSSTEAAEAPK